MKEHIIEGITLADIKQEFRYLEGEMKSRVDKRIFKEFLDYIIKVFALDKEYIYTRYIGGKTVNDREDLEVYQELRKDLDIFLELDGVREFLETKEEEFNKIKEQK